MKILKVLPKRVGVWGFFWGGGLVVFFVFSSSESSKLNNNCLQVLLFPLCLGFRNHFLPFLMLKMYEFNLTVY